MPGLVIRDTDLSIADVLELIGKGYSHKQILETHPQLTLGDIMLAAQVANDLIARIDFVDGQLNVRGVLKFTVRKGQFQSLDELRKEHARAFAKWTDDEVAELERLFKGGEEISKIARHLQRSNKSVRMRLEHIGLIEPSDANEPVGAR